MVDQFTKGAVGAAGALAVDIALQKLPLPAQLTANPIMKAATQGFIGIGLGMLMKKVGKGGLGKSMAEGAVTVALYNAGKGVIGPQLGLSGIDDGLLGYSDFDDDLGYINPTTVSPWDDGEMNGFEEF